MNTVYVERDGVTIEVLEADEAHYKALGFKKVVVKGHKAEAHSGLAEESAKSETKKPAAK